MDLGIANRTVLITGGDSGIGWSTAKLLLGEGATVVLTDKDPELLQTAAAKLEAPEGKLHAIAADLRNLDEINALRDEVVSSAGAINTLVHCAGVTGAQGLFHEIDDEGWVSTIEIDLLAAVRGSSREYGVARFHPHADDRCDDG